MSILSATYSSAADQAAAWSQARASSMSSYSQQNSTLLNSLAGDTDTSTNTMSSMLAGSAGGDGSIVSMLGGSTTSTQSTDAAALFGGGLGSTAEDALQAAVDGSVSDSLNSEENLMASTIQARLAKAQASADPQPGMVFHRIA